MKLQAYYFTNITVLEISSVFKKKVCAYYKKEMKHDRYINRTVFKGEGVKERY